MTNDNKKIKYSGDFRKTRCTEVAQVVNPTLSIGTVSNRALHIPQPAACEATIKTTDEEVCNALARNPNAQIGIFVVEE